MTRWHETDYISQFGYQLYDTTGTTDDYLYDALGAFSYTPEIGKPEFHPAYSRVHAGVRGPPGDRPLRRPDGQARSAACARPTRSPGETAIDARLALDPAGTAPAGRTLRIRKTITLPDQRPARRRRLPVPGPDAQRRPRIDADRPGRRAVRVARQPVPPAARLRPGARLLAADVRGRRGQRARVSATCTSSARRSRTWR